MNNIQSGGNDLFERRKFPERITVELTNRCNLECTFCPRHLVDMKLGNMAWNLFQKIVDEASKHLPMIMPLFFRGESLTHPELCKMIRYAKEKGIGPIQLASNGFLLDDKMGDSVIASGLDFISFSLDTIDAEVYRETRIHSDLHIAMDNVVAFVKKCEKLKAEGKQVPEIQVSSVDIADYKASQQKFIDFWRQYADRVRIYIEHSSDGNLGSIKALHDENERRKPCGKVYNDMIIYWDGRVGICNHDWDNRLDIGNVSEASIEAIWNSDKYNAIRDMHESGVFTDDIVCKNCDHWKIYYSPEGFVGKAFDKIPREE